MARPQPHADGAGQLGPGPAQGNACPVDAGQVAQGAGPEVGDADQHRDGLEGLSIGRLAVDLGVSKSGLFGYLGSKDELQIATVRTARDV